MNSFAELLSSNNQRPDTMYRGRFAPSPSGELHFGSLVTALASYLDAKSKNGIWLVRIEDIDPPREKKGASHSILATLENFGLHWDEQVLFQSAQTDYYQSILSDLNTSNSSYFCQCTRAQIKAAGGIYQGQCRELSLVPSTSSPMATRVINTAPITQFDDLIQGLSQVNAELAAEDFIVKRKDGLFAYQLAVVADDIYQNISHVIRGCDLLEPTARQLSFFNILKAKTPQYGHVPLAVTEQGYKLSKQNNALAVNSKKPVPSLLKALSFLGLPVEKQLGDGSIEEILQWAIQHWSLATIPKQQQISIENQSGYSQA